MSRPSPQPADAANAPPTQTNLVLSAVFASEDPAKGLAIIGESAQSAKVFAVGGAVRAGHASCTPCTSIA